MVMSAESAWNSTVTGSAQIGILADTLSTIYALVFLAMIIWLFIGLFENWSSNKMRGWEAAFLGARSIGLMLFTFYMFV